MNVRIRIQLTLILFLVIFPAGFTLADNTALQEKLKHEVALKLDDVTIDEALEKIGEQAGITIELSDEAIWELPEGAQTRLSVALEGQLADSLEQMLNAFFMRYAVGSDAVVIYPRPELKHIMGRPTPKTLALLRNIYTNSMLVQGDAKSVEQMAQALISQMAGEDVFLSPIDVSRYVARTIGQMVEGSLKGVTISLGPILDEVTEQRGNGRDEWLVCAAEFPNQSAQIKIVSRQKYARASFDRVVDVSFDAATGLMILKHLAVMADIELEFNGDDRDWLDQKISIDALNVTVREALTRVTAALGGEGTITGDGVYVVREKKTAQTPAARARAEAIRRAKMAAVRHAANDSSVPQPIASATARDDYVGKISIPMDGGRYFIEFMLRESDLTDELRQLRAQRIQEILKAASSPTEKTPAP